MPSVDDLLDAWEQIAAEKARVQAGLQYGPFEAGLGQPLLHEPLDPDLKREPPQSERASSGASGLSVTWSRQVPVIVRRLDGGTPEPPHEDLVRAPAEPALCRPYGHPAEPDRHHLRLRGAMVELPEHAVMWRAATRW